MNVLRPLAALVLVLIVAACATPDAPRPGWPPPGPCANRDHEWDYQRNEILRLNPGYGFNVISPHQAFVDTFNAEPPKSNRPMPDMAGYFSKPGDEVAILAFVKAECVVLLEITSHTSLQVLIRRSNSP
ncbi:MAG: hypothetical protein HOE26_10465 [Rhodospirillaceae bacterium]|jgi:hypothetical protein|nr:hypothetical protein [Rhodospirillaceae bacterium]MBT7355387.1 hypothetical protein [Rhodospirillaceae bacterium]